MSATRLGATAAVLGLAAGLLELGLGTHPIVGDKADPGTLGLVTVGLAVVVAVCARVAPSVGFAGRLFCGLGLVGAALVGTTTAGVAWLPAGILGITAGTQVLRLSSRGGRPVGLLGTYAVDLLAVPPVLVLLLFAVVAGGAPGLVGGLGAVTALLGLAVRRDRPLVGWCLLTAGVVPFAALTWWTVVTPVSAALALALGLAPPRRPPDLAHSRSLAESPVPEGCDDPSCERDRRRHRCGRGRGRRPGARRGDRPAPPTGGHAQHHR